MNTNFPFQNPASDPSGFVSVTLDKSGLGAGFCIGDTMPYKDKAKKRITEGIYKALHAEEIRKYQIQYYLDHKSELIEYAEAWHRNHPEQTRNKDKTWEAKNPEKIRAHHKINNMIRDGKLFKPSICEMCGVKPKRIVAHHWHGYDDEHILDVQWLCSQCHKNAHHNMPRPGAA
jgi:hypothetical protein